MVKGRVISIPPHSEKGKVSFQSKNGRIFTHLHTSDYLIEIRQSKFKFNILI
jgi:hypothetical protein